MNPRPLLVIGLAIDAVGGFLLYTGAFQENGRRPWLAASALAVLVAGIAVTNYVRPGRWSLLLARGVAGVFLLSLTLLGLLGLIAYMTDRQNGDSNELYYILFFGVYIGVQALVLNSARRIDGKSFVESIPTTANGTFLFWAIGVALALVATFVQNFMR